MRTLLLLCMKMTKLMNHIYICFAEIADETLNLDLNEVRDLDLHFLREIIVSSRCQINPLLLTGYMMQPTRI